MKKALLGTLVGGRGGGNAAGRGGYAADASSPTDSAACRPAVSESKALDRYMPHILCPLSNEIMEEPVVCADGRSYEHSFIQQWFDEGHRVSPATQLELPNTVVIPNSTLRELIHTMVSELPSVQRDAVRQKWAQKHIDAMKNWAAHVDQAGAQLAESTPMRPTALVPSGGQLFIVGCSRDGVDGEYRQLEGKHHNRPYYVQLPQGTSETHYLFFSGISLGWVIDTEVCTRTAPVAYLGDTCTGEDVCKKGHMEYWMVRQEGSSAIGGDFRPELSMEISRDKAATAGAHTQRPITLAASGQATAAAVQGASKFSRGIRVADCRCSELNGDYEELPQQQNGFPMYKRSQGSTSHFVVFSRGAPTIQQSVAAKPAQRRYGKVSVYSCRRRGLDGEYTELERLYNGQPVYQKSHKAGDGKAHCIYFSGRRDMGWVIGKDTSSEDVPMAYLDDTVDGGCCIWDKPEDDWYVRWEEAGSTTFKPDPMMRVKHVQLS